MRLLVVALGVLGAVPIAGPAGVAAASGSGSGGQGRLSITVLSGRADLVSGGDALVAIRGALRGLG